MRKVYTTALRPRKPGKQREKKTAICLRKNQNYADLEDRRIRGRLKGCGIDLSGLLRTRTSAAYRGICALLQRQGSKDFFWKARMVDLDCDECKIDIHHIFPRDWCVGQKIAPRVFNAIVNKTPISYKANRMIGGKAPSKYIEQIQNHAQVQISADEMDDIFKTHLVDPTWLRADDFEGFYTSRKNLLIKLIEDATGKTVLPADTEAPPEDEEDDGATEIRLNGKSCRTTRLI